MFKSNKRRNRQKETTLFWKERNFDKNEAEGDWMKTQSIMQSTLFEFIDPNAPEPEPAPAIEVPKWNEIINEYSDYYDEFNEEYHHFKNHIARNDVTIFLQQAEVEITKEVPSNRTKTGYVKKKVPVKGYIVYNLITAENVAEGNDKDTFANIIHHEKAFENLEEAKKFFEELKSYLEDWKYEAEFTMQPERREGFFCEDCQKEIELNNSKNHNTGHRCVREQMTGLSYLTNRHGESEYMCPTCPEIYKNLCHAKTREKPTEERKC